MFNYAFHLSQSVGFHLDYWYVFEGGQGFALRVLAEDVEGTVYLAVQNENSFVSSLTSAQLWVYVLPEDLVFGEVIGAAFSSGEGKFFEEEDFGLFFIEGLVDHWKDVLVCDFAIFILILSWNCVLVVDIIEGEGCIDEEGFAAARGTEDEEGVEICVLKEVF